MKSRVDGRTLRAEQKRASTRENLMRTARALFAERGYDDVSIDDIIAAADISRGTFYLHFDTKRSVVGAMLDGMLEALRTAIVPVAVERPHDEQLRGNFERVIDALAQHRDVASLLLGTNEPELKARLEEFNAHVIRTIRKALAAGQRLGLIRDMDLDVASIVALGAIRETVLRRLFSHSLGPAKRRALADELLTALLFGIMAR